MNEKGIAFDKMAYIEDREVKRRSFKYLNTLDMMYKFTCREIQLCADSATKENRLWSRQNISSLPNSAVFGSKSKTFTSFFGNNQSLMAERVDGRSSKIELLPISSSKEPYELTEHECLSFKGLKERIIDHLKRKNTCLQIFQIPSTSTSTQVTMETTSTGTQAWVETVDSSCQSAFITTSTGVQVKPEKQDQGCQTSASTRQPTLVNVAVQTEAADYFETGAGDVAKEITKDIPSHIKHNPVVVNDVLGPKEVPLLQTEPQVPQDLIAHIDVEDDYDISDDEELPAAYFKSTGEQDQIQRNTVSLADELSLAMTC